MYSIKRLIKIAVVLAIATLFVATFVLPLAAQEASKAPANAKMPPKPPAPPLLNGKIFDGKLLQKGVSEKPMDETITFKDGILNSTYFESQGYKPGPYRTKKVKGVITFTAGLKQSTDATMVAEWTGSVAKDKQSTAMTITATIKTTKDGKPIYEFSLGATERIAETPPPAK